jgi:hypothetical protein
MAYPSSPLNEFWDSIIDEARCRDVDGVGGRCQIVLGHAGQRLLQRNGQRYGWPVGAKQIRPPFAPGGFPRDE